jgi:hypothetical protein
LLKKTLSSLPAKERTVFRRWVFQLLPAVVQPTAVSHFQLHDTFSSLPAKERTAFRRWVFQLLSNQQLLNSKIPVIKNMSQCENVTC